MKFLSTDEIRKIWIDFFESKNHLFVPPKSLIPVNDPSLLWINSGVATLKDYFSGKKNPPSNRIVNVQKAIRTNDILNVGVTARHHTFFEMLGNFSIGDYFKEEAIEFGFELLTKKFEIPLDRLYFTVFKDDTVAYNKWVSLGVNPNRIIKGDRDRNFWDVGQGPCGPCTEIHFDRGEKYDPNKIGEKLIFEDIENDRYVEIWNIVFSQFNNDGKNNYTELARKNIDTGAGLERLACIFQDVPTNYDADNFQFIIKELEKLSPKKYDMNAYFFNDLIQKQINHDYIVIVDHIKANVFAISDGAIPSNKERGSVLRKLIRRAMVCARRLEINQEFIGIVVKGVIKVMKSFYPDIEKNQEHIIKVLTDEERLFNKTLDNGFNLFKKALNENKLNSEVAFKLTETYGFPYEIIEELITSHGLKIDQQDYQNRVKHHQEISKSKKDIKGMMSQNATLLNFKEKSFFDYDQYEIKGAKIIGLFDKDFKQVESLNTNGWVVFDKTVFYATSGGQTHDVGKITINNNSIQVDDVIKGPNAQHFHHIINNTLIKLNDSADLIIDVHNRQLATRNHSTEHILHKTLREVVSYNVKQEGAFKSPEKLTFDFACDHHLSEQELLKIENRVNEYIKSAKDVHVDIMSIEQARQAGAVGHFENVYKKVGNNLRVVKMDGITSDICGGTHVHNTREIEQFMITKFYTVGGGLYRIEAITSYETINKHVEQAIASIKQKIDLMNDFITKNNILNNEYKELLSTISYKTDLDNYHSLTNKFKQLSAIYEKLMLSFNKASAKNLISDIKQSYLSLDKTSKYLVNVFQQVDAKTLASALTELANQDKEHIYIGINKISSKLQYVLMANKEYCAKNNFSCNALIKQINEISKGSGGGRDNFAQGGTTNIDTLEQIKNFLK